MSHQDLLDRLAIQIESLQEGFELLSKAPTTKDLARQFFHLLRGNLTVVEGHIFFKDHSSSGWQKLFGKGELDSAHLNDVPVEKTFALKPVKDASIAVIASQPLIDGSHTAVFLGRKLDRSKYSEPDYIAFRMLLQLFANAYQSLLHRQKEKGLVFSLNHRLLQLNSLIDTGIKLSRLHEESSLHRMALERAASLTNASRGSVKVSTGKVVKEKISFPVGASLRRPQAKSHRIRSSFKFAGQTYAFELLDKESRAGTIPFDETDQLLLDALTRQVHAVLENHYLHLQELEKQKTDRDISVAASIQQRILPKKLPAIEGYDLSGTNIPTRFVGGDYYDCIPLSDGRYVLVMADVSGKGVPAALLVSSFHAYLFAYLESDISLLELTRRLNTVIYRESTEERYITAALGFFTPVTGELEIVNAGHTATYLMRNDATVLELTKGGLALGMLDMDFPYESDHVVVGHGEQLLLYTDGVTEAMNAREQLYDAEGALKNLFQHHKAGSAEEFIQILLADLKAFTGSAPQNDDITAMYLVRK